MFSYSTETIINDPSFIEAKYVPANAAEQDRIYKGLYIKGVNLFQKEFICNVTKRPYVQEQNAQITLDLTTNKDNVSINVPAAGCTIRLKIATKQVGLVSSIYKDAQLVNNKPFFYEVTVTSDINTWDKIGKAFEAVIKKDMQKTDFKFFNVVNASGVLTITAEDCYTRFVEARVDYVDEQNLSGLPANTLAPSYTGFEDYKPLNAKFTLVKEGTEGAGTVKRLIKNLRIPTDARTNPFAPDFGGLPVPGGEYDQYVIEYVTERRFIGHQVMGAIDKSVTTHVLFLNSAAPCGVGNSVSDKFEAELAKVMGEGFDIKDHTIASGTPATTFVEGSTQPKDIVALKSDVAAAESAAASKTTAAEVKDIVASATVTIPAESIDGTNPTEAQELAVTLPSD